MAKSHELIGATRRESVSVGVLALVRAVGAHRRGVDLSGGTQVSDSLVITLNGATPPDVLRQLANALDVYIAKLEADEVHRVGYLDVGRPDIGHRVVRGSQAGGEVNLGSSSTPIERVAFFADRIEVSGESFLFCMWPGGWIEVER